MVDPTSDHGEDVPDEEAPRCAVCDDRIVYEADHRVVTWIEDNTVETVHFCDEACRSDWNRTEG